jgi:hypothetical protein
LALMPARVPAQRIVLVDFGKDFDLARAECRDAKLSLHDGALHMEVAATGGEPQVVLRPAEGRWNLTRYHEVAVEVRNLGKQPVTVGCRAEDPDADGKRHSSTATVTLTPGERNVLRVTLTQAMPPELRMKLFGMRALPMGISADIDSSHVTRLVLFVAQPAGACLVEIGSPRAWFLSEPNQPIDEDAVLPMIDQCGQFIHKEWPGKVHSADDLAAHRKAEAADLAAHPGPADWDQYGGWKGGPQLNATGFFRTEKYQGKWWLVDPEGHLFWSVGMNCVTTRYGARTAITDREHWFVDLPSPDSPLGQFYSTSSRAAHGYYKLKDEFTEFNFTRANLFRKYGPDWETQYDGLTERRLRSWGINTIACMSDVRPFRQKTPYVGMIGTKSKKIAGSTGYWRQFPDVFDPGFADDARQRMQREKDKIGDPWCIGFFVENEMGWGDETSLAVATLRSPPEQVAKQVFVADLKAKYATIDKLNAVWGTKHASWEALLQSTTPPNQDKARTDLESFTTKIAERYFEVTREAIREAAPQHLDLGCRFSRSNPLAVRAAAKYCDVVSFNRYQYTVADLRLPEGADKPIFIGEFQFGALDRGVFNPSLSPTEDQQDRAQAFKDYVHSALGNPNIVGVHWFQLIDQAATGRTDEENFQIGFLDVCDTPYSEMIQASREVTEGLYQTRSAP